MVGEMGLSVGDILTQTARNESFIHFYIIAPLS